MSRKGDGTLMGQSASDLIGFYGLATCVAQPATIAAVGTTAATTTTPWGFGSSTQADAVITAVNACSAALRTLGLVAAS